MNPECIKPLPFKEIPMPAWYDNQERRGYWTNRMRVMFFDPSQVYESLADRIDPYKRIQNTLTLELIFPKRTDTLCRCGCGGTARKSWATDLCSNFAYKVYRIITYGTADARVFIETYYGTGCIQCQANGCDVDHIIPVKHGGGGCWLSNFALLCQTCHKDKTKRDFKWKEYNGQLDFFRHQRPSDG